VSLQLSIEDARLALRAYAAAGPDKDRNSSKEIQEHFL